MPSRIESVAGRPPLKGYSVDVVPKGLEIGEYDYSSYTRNAGNFITSIIFKLGGASGITVSTLTIARDSDNFVTSVTQT